MLHPFNRLGLPPLNLLQQLNELPVLGSPELDAALQAGGTQIYSQSVKVYFQHSELQKQDSFSLSTFSIILGSYMTSDRLWKTEFCILSLAGNNTEWVSSWDTASLRILLLAAGMWHGWGAQCLSQQTPGKMGLPGTGHQIWPLLFIQKVTDVLNWVKYW